MSDRGPAVLDGELRYTSVSAMQKFDATREGCARAWFFRYVERRPDKPQSKGAKRGEEGHARIEHYLRTGEDVLDPLERRGLEFMPSPSEVTAGRALVEERLDGRMMALDVPLIGKADLIELAARPRVTDWKFKKSIEQYACRAEELSRDLQMVGYGAFVAGHLASDAPEVELRHVTFQTQGRAWVQPSSATVPAEGLRERWQAEGERLIPAMRRTARAVNAFDVEPNESACLRFGGCAYLEICSNPLARIQAGFARRQSTAAAAAIGGSTIMGVLSAIGITKNGAASTAAPAPTPSPQATRAAPSTHVHVPARDAEQGATYVVNGQPGTFIARTRFGAQEFCSFAPLSGGTPLLAGVDQLVQLIAPVVPLKVAPPTVLPPDAPTMQLAAPPSPPAPETTAPETTATMPPPIEAPKRGPGRPRKIEAASPEHPAVSPASPAVADKVRGLHLYFGCAPIGQATQTLHAFVDATQATIFAEAKKKDARVIEGDLRLSSDELLGFGKWRGWLALLAREAPPAPGHYVVTRGDERCEVAAQALLPLAESVTIAG